MNYVFDRLLGEIKYVRGKKTNRIVTVVPGFQRVLSPR